MTSIVNPSVLAAAAIASISSAPAAAASPDAVNLAGTWSVVLDRADAGRRALEVDTEDAEVFLPGSLQAQDLGDRPTFDSPWIGDVRENEWNNPVYDDYRDDDNFKWPFWLQPERVYVGPAWYSRTISVPTSYAGHNVALHLERAHWVSEVWLDGSRIGADDSLSVPQVFDLGKLEPGTYDLDIRVDNRVAHPVGPNAHSITDHTQTNWNGIIGQIELRATPDVAIENIRVTPSAADRTALVEVTLTGGLDDGSPVTITAHADAGTGTTATATIEMAGNGDGPFTANFNLDLGPDAPLWSEFNPVAYELTVTVDSAAGTHTDTTWFGLRDLTSAGGRFILNGTPVFLRGTLECAIFPLTGYPAMDKEEWAFFFDRMKEFGLNHMRFHSWCPPRAAFLAADEAGIYLQVEGPFWVNQGPALGQGQSIDQYVYDETDRIIAEYGNHPSFLLLAYGNEPGGPANGAAYLAEWVEHYKAKDPRRLYTSGSGWPLIEESEFHVAYQPRIQRWGEGLDSTMNSQPPSTRRDYNQFNAGFEAPVIAHEIGQWCVFPDFGEMAKYTGHLKPKNFEVFSDLLHNNAMGDRARDFLMASGRLQVLAYKEEVEAALRTTDYGGFQLLDIRDFPGQGTALVGVLDPFWDPKDYITGDEWRQFCAPIVPLARFDGRVFNSGDAFTADIEVAQFGAGDLTGVRMPWAITTEAGETIAQGVLTPADMPAGYLAPAGTIDATLRSSEPTRVVLTVSIEGTEAVNTWDLWVFPDAPVVDLPRSIHETDMLDDEALAILERGGTVLLMPETEFTEGGVEFGFSPVFWNTAWTNGQAPQTLGLTVEPDHPLFAEFPTGFHTDWQWWDLIGHPGARAGAMILTDLPSELRPLVQPIDTWFRSRRLASLFEARVGEGRLVVSALDLRTDLDERPSARQFRRTLFRYMTSAEFAPAVEVDPADVSALFATPNPLTRVGATASSNTRFERGYAPANAIDGDPRTLWHTRWTGNAAGPFPYDLTVTMEEPVEIAGVSYTGRQDNNVNGKINRYEVEITRDGQTWTRAAAGRFTTGLQPQEVRFDAPVTVRGVRLIALSSHSGADHAAVGEFGLLPE